MKSALTLPALWLSVSCASRILLLPVDHGSHVNNLVIFGNALMSAGHDITLLTSQRHANVVSRMNANATLLYAKDNDFGLLIESMINTVLSGDSFSGFSDIIPAFRNMSKLLEEEIVFYLTDPEIQNAVGQCDLAIIDGMDFYRPIYALPYKLGIPYITVTPRVDPWNLGVPAMPSIEPFFPVVNLDDNSSILDRTKNLLLYAVMNNVVPLLIEMSNVIAEYVPEKPYKSLAELFLESEMIFVLHHPVCLDYPRVEMPHYKMIGGIGATKSPNSSPKDLKEFTDFIGNSPFVVLTFGSMIKQIPESRLSNILRAFSKFPNFKFIMRNLASETKVPTNVKMAAWIPQNDLLAHPNVRLFITHGGNNGQMEAAYHGVPMLVMPLFGDHIYNAKRAKRLGTTESIDYYGFTAQDLGDMLSKMLADESYMQNARRCGNILQSLPSAQETGVFWVNHVLKHGGSHLRPLDRNMPLYKLFCLDSIVLIVLVMYIVYRVSKFILSRMCALCCSRKLKKD